MNSTKCVAITLLLSVIAGNAQAGSALGPRLDGGISFGYYDGYTFQGTLTIADFATGFPLAAEFGLGYTRVEPGKAPEARRIFINNATDGVPEESGRIWDFRLDLLYALNPLTGDNLYLCAGPRHTRFTGNFKYIGGNEDFDVTSKQWGIGAGLKALFPMGSRVKLVLSGGFDYLFESKLSGHDTSYSPDGEIVNGREDYQWDDADDAIDQPALEPRITVGFSYRLK